MVIKCDICGFLNTDTSDYCGGCGVDLREPRGDAVETPVKLKILRSKKPSKPPREESDENRFRIVKWCWIRNFQLPHVLVLLSFLAEGRSVLGFCDCATCNQGYREILAFVAGVSGEKEINPASREIVKKAQGVDITKITYSISELIEVLGSENKTGVAHKPIVKPIQSARVNGGKLLIELDDAIIERAVVKVLRSEEGQNLIKKASVRQKRNKKDLE